MVDHSAQVLSHLIQRWEVIATTQRVGRSADQLELLLNVTFQVASRRCLLARGHKRGWRLTVPAHQSWRRDWQMAANFYLKGNSISHYTASLRWKWEKKDTTAISYSNNTCLLPNYIPLLMPQHVFRLKEHPQGIWILTCPHQTLSHWESISTRIPNKIWLCPAPHFQLK